MNEERQKKKNKHNKLVIYSILENYKYPNKIKDVGNGHCRLQGSS